VGRSGKLLDELLGVVPLNRSDVYITNVVKCRPPDNRDPLPEEVRACWPYLEAQISLIKPKVIATLGRHAMNRFLRTREYLTSMAVRPCGGISSFSRSTTRLRHFARPL